jgi:hypothetical protein
MDTPTSIISIIILFDLRLGYVEADAGPLYVELLHDVRKV